MVIVVWLHMLRVFLTGSYKPPREFNWCVGVVLLVATMLLAFTGYLLPWDQLSLWAVTVGSNMVGAAGSGFRSMILGGRTVGEETLNRFYVFHCIGIPLLASFFIALHFWRVRKDGGMSGPGEG
jgi:quinol-cytochrome oxidoreductase complex cytochrome b subunit